MSMEGQGGKNFMMEVFEQYMRQNPGPQSPETLERVYLWCHQQKIGAALLAGFLTGRLKMTMPEVPDGDPVFSLPEASK